MPVNDGNIIQIPFSRAGLRREGQVLHLFQFKAEEGRGDHVDGEWIVSPDEAVHRHYAFFDVALCDIMSMVGCYDSVYDGKSQAVPRGKYPRISDAV